jgi:non-lysosomal glucosylceramidase
MSTGRRGFLKTVALAGGVAQAGAGQTGSTPAQPPAQAGTASAPARPPFAYRRTFTGRQLQQISFPLGGVAAGSIGLGGRGQLRDWQIFNRPDYGHAPSYAFPAIWVQVGEGKPVARVLESRLMPPYEAASGLSPGAVSGLERLEEATFTGEYPMAAISFRDPTLPVRVALEAFSPFIPLDEEDSGLPVAILRYRVMNPGKEKAKVSIAWSLDNPVGIDGRSRSGNPGTEARSNEARQGQGIAGLLMTNPGTAQDAPVAGSLAICAAGAAEGSITMLRGWPQAKWWASPLLFWDDFSSDGRLGPEAGQRNGVGSISWQREIAAGESADYTFLIAWHFPNRTPAWCGWQAPSGEENANIGNHYCGRFRDAWQAAEYTAANLERLEKRTRQFLAAMRRTTLPAAVKEAAMANLSTLATPTCFRTRDGRFRGFEGINDDRGCCHGSCTHVWNYESATQYLFPALARSMREAAFELSGRLDGVMPIRISLPEGKQTGGTTAADGTMGQIIKTRLDWRLSGDDAWLGRMWPRVKKALEFAWVPGGWDGDRDGVAEGVQHNTYDVEFYGPNPMCGIYYLGALRAGEEMARKMGEVAFAAECRRLFENGSRWIDANLFNGRYYIQKTRGIPVEQIAKPLQSRGGAEDPEHPDFQLGEGCLVDQLVGQYVADFAGLGPLVDPGNVRKTLQSIYRYNYKRSLYRHNSVQRIFALNDEAALVICDYGAAARPKVPFPYFAEVMTGFEYSAAVLMLEHGMVKEGVECIENIRRRYDGERRNPWDEAECGRHYARAMAAWSGVVALGGFVYGGSERVVRVFPKVTPERFNSFWSTATGWGSFTQSIAGGRTRLTVATRFGTLPLRSVELAGGGAASSVTLASKAVAHEAKRDGARVVVSFREEVTVQEGEELAITA